MGRKIPGRKHRGVRDPEKQKLVREALLKNKVNATPKDIDAQDVPKSLIRIQELQKQMTKEKKRNDLGNRKKSPSSRKLIKSGIFLQRTNETEKQFVNRVNVETATTIKEAAFADKYKVDIIRNKETGRVESLKKRQKDEIESYLHKVKKEQKNQALGKKKKKIEPKIKLSKWQKKQKKAVAKKEQSKLNALDEFINIKDTVEFGEVIHAPPSLTLPRLAVKRLAKSADTDTSKPGQRNLLLKDLNKPTSSIDKLQAIKGKAIDKTAKRKVLPAVLRKQLDHCQQQAIAAYRQLKQNNEKSS